MTNPGILGKPRLASFLRLSAAQVVDLYPYPRPVRERESTCMLLTVVWCHPVDLVLGGPDHSRAVKNKIE